MRTCGVPSSRGLHEDDTFFGCEVDHIISEKHGGPTESANLALACFVCNRRKGSDIGSVVPGSGLFVRFFNPVLTSGRRISRCRRMV